MPVWAIHGLPFSRKPREHTTSNLNCAQPGRRRTGSLLSLRRCTHLHIDIEKLTNQLPSVFAFEVFPQVCICSRNAKGHDGPAFRNPLKFLLTQVTGHECTVRCVTNKYTVDCQNLVFCHFRIIQAVRGVDAIMKPALSFCVPSARNGASIEDHGRSQ